MQYKEAFYFEKKCPCGRVLLYSQVDFILKNGQSIFISIICSFFSTQECSTVCKNRDVRMFIILVVFQKHISGQILNLGKSIFKGRVFLHWKVTFLTRKWTNVVADNGLWLRALPAENSPNVSNLLLEVLKEFSHYFQKNFYNGQCQEIFSLPGFSSNSSFRGIFSFIRLDIRSFQGFAGVNDTGATKKSFSQDTSWV
jgi:hypothetical protein